MWLAGACLLLQRVFLYAAKFGYQLPTPPIPTYEAPPGAQRAFVDQKRNKKLTDPTFLPKEVRQQPGSMRPDVPTGLKLPFS